MKEVEGLNLMNQKLVKKLIHYSSCFPLSSQPIEKKGQSMVGKEFDSLSHIPHDEYSAIITIMRKLV